MLNPIALAPAAGTVATGVVITAPAVAVVVAGAAVLVGVAWATNRDFAFSVWPPSFAVKKSQETPA